MATPLSLTAERCDIELQCQKTFETAHTVCNQFHLVWDYYLC